MSRWTNSLAAAAALLCLACGTAGHAADDRLEFLIPGDEGSGWNLAAHATGTALQAAGLVPTVTYRNLVGAGGGRALLELSGGGDALRDTLMIQSAALIIRNVGGQIKQSYRDVVPVASLFAEYEAVVVPPASPIHGLGDLLADLKAHPDHVLAGGSTQFSLDRVLAGKIFEASGNDPKKIRYSPHDSDQKAIAELLEKADSGMVALVSGVGDVLPDVKAGKVRLIAVSSPKRLDGIDSPTLKDGGMDLVLANWRGFFVQPGTPADKIQHYQDLIQAVSKSEKWQQLLKENGWDNFVLAGAEFRQFLDQQEADTRKMLAQ